ncbi:hypothetical protein PFISCL1PPCAC_24142, partial [Pristionchus fissidentatus]
VQAVAKRDFTLGQLMQKRAFRRQIGEETSFCRLPGEILTNIFSYLPFKDRLLSRVSSRLVQIEKSAPVLRLREEAEYRLTVEFLPRDEIKITTLILMEEEWDDIIKEIYLPFHSAFSLINTKIRTMKLKGVRLINMGNLRIDQMEQLCELIPFLSVKEFIDVNNCFNEELKVSQVSFEVRRFIEILKRNKNLLRFDFTAATINVTAEQLMEIRRIHSMLNLRGFAIRIECCEIDEIVSSIFGLEIVRDGWITREMMESGLLTTQRQADVFARSTSSPPSLFRRELEETGEEGRMVTRIDRDEKNPMIYEY